MLLYDYVYDAFFCNAIIFCDSIDQGWANLFKERAACRKPPTPASRKISLHKKNITAIITPVTQPEIRSVGDVLGPGGETPSRRERQGGLGAEPPAQKNFLVFFAKTTYFKDNLIKINAFKTLHRN